MADKPYRFLFRMPHQLRDRLVASADEHGRSLNSELLHRLEQSLEAEARIPLTARIAAAVRARADRAPAIRRVGLALATGLTVAVAGAAGVSSLRGETSARTYDLAPPTGAVVRVPFPAVKRSVPARVPASRNGTAG